MNVALLDLKRWLIILALGVGAVLPARAQSVPPGGVLVLYDSSGTYGWIGGLHARMLANLLGHFELPYVISPVESYQTGAVHTARATFYLGTVYDNPLPAAFVQDVLTTTNRVVWSKYNLWQLPATNVTAQFGFTFNWLDWSGYSNIVYKGESFPKNQLDPEVGFVSIVDTNRALVPATANRTATNGITTTIPYVVHAGNFWYVADSPFDYIAEEDRYTVFCDLLHDMLGIDHAENHRAIIRLEDVAPTMYEPEVLRATTDLLKSNNVPFAVAFVPIYTDPLGAYNGGTPVYHRLADTNDPDARDFVAASHYMVTNGAQLLIHGYTHQYGSVANPYNGVTGDDFEFWRETFNTTTTNDPYDLDIYAPVPEDSSAWVLGRINAAKSELAQVGLTAVGFEFPHYAGSEVASRTVATNFPLTMHRVLYFDDAGHIAGQYFPYVIHRDIYGQKIIPENIGNIEPEPWMNYPARSAADMIRAAKKNLVVRDGWANGYFHPFYSLTNLSALITGIKALGYTYVPLVPASPVLTMTSGATAGALTLNFPTEAGFNYRVEYSSTLSSTNWLTWTNTAGTGGLRALSMPAPVGGQRFFRLRVE